MVIVEHIEIMNLVFREYLAGRPHRLMQEYNAALYRGDEKFLKDLEYFIYVRTEEPIGAIRKLLSDLSVH